MRRNAPAPEIAPVDRILIVVVIVTCVKSAAAGAGQALLALQHVLPRIDSVDAPYADCRGPILTLHAGWMAPEFLQQLPQSLLRPAIGVMHVVALRNVDAMENAGTHYQRRLGRDHGASSICCCPRCCVRA